MKAVKIYHIDWNIPKNASAESVAALPTIKGYVVDNNFETCMRIPTMLKKKFGFSINSFSFHEYRIAENVRDLLLMCKTGKKEKELFTDAGNLTKFGKDCLAYLKSSLEYNVVLRRNGTPEENIPVLIDEILLSIKKITGIDTDNAMVSEMMSALNTKIINHIAVNFKDDEEDYDEDDD